MIIQNGSDIWVCKGWRVDILQRTELTCGKCRLENMKWGISWSNQCCKLSSQKPALFMQVILLPLRCYSSYLCFCGMRCSVLCFTYFCASQWSCSDCAKYSTSQNPTSSFMSLTSPVPSWILLGADKVGQWCLQLLLGPGNTANPIDTVIEIDFPGKGVLWVLSKRCFKSLNSLSTAAITCTFYPKSLKRI